VLLALLSRLREVDIDVGIMIFIKSSPIILLTEKIRCLMQFFREIILWRGAVDASASTARRVLTQGWSLLVYVGEYVMLFQ